MKSEEKDKMTARRTRSLQTEKLEETEEKVIGARIVWSRSNEEHSGDIEQAE